MSEFDFIAVGSGAAGMLGALAAASHGLSALVVEKAATFGGSTARSGGGVWIPGNEVLRRAGVTDTPEQASTYLAHIAGDDVPARRREAFLEHGPAALALLLARTPVRFAWVPDYPDYYPEAPGGRAGGRTIEPAPLDGRVLGDELDNLTPPYLPVPNGMTVTAAKYRWLSLGTRHRKAVTTAARLAVTAVLNRARGRRMLTMGQALAAGMRAGLRDLGVQVWLNTSLFSLYWEGSRIAGVWLDQDGQSLLVRARHGVLLASGGFERDETMRRQYQRAPIGVDWTVGARTNTGDGIRMGATAGADLALMDDAWWGPSIPLPGGPYFCLAERSLPGCVMVDGRGERFVNEAAPYVDAVHAMYEHDSVPAWLVFDQTYRDRYLFAGKGPRQPFPGRWYKSGAVQRADALADLPFEALTQTVERFNGFARAGHDDDFGKGDSAYDRYYGDPRNRPNPCLGELRKPPFYAVKLVPGDLGTKGGLVTDERARVLKPDGSPIPGLYAAGNASASVMGHSYAGAGATIGPALAFGYIAALDAASVQLRST